MALDYVEVLNRGEQVVEVPGGKDHLDEAPGALLHLVEGPHGLRSALARLGELSFDFGDALLVGIDLPLQILHARDRLLVGGVDVVDLALCLVELGRAGL